MDSIELIRDNLARSEEIVLSRIEEMRDHSLVLPSPGGGCHTLWILGHLAYIEYLVVQNFMLGQPNPMADKEEIFDTTEISVDPRHYPPFDRVLNDCRAARRATMKLLSTFSESDLDRVSSSVPDAKDAQGVDRLFGTHRRCFQYVSDHWLMHRGQLADARCAAGLPRMWY